MLSIQRAPHALSKVSGFEGPCIATWINGSCVPGLGRSHRYGATGFFRLCKPVIPGWIYWRYGPEFHGGSLPETGGTVVVSTETPDPYAD